MGLTLTLMQDGSPVATRTWTAADLSTDANDLAWELSYGERALLADVETHPLRLEHTWTPDGDAVGVAIDLLEAAFEVPYVEEEPEPEGVTAMASVSFVLGCSSVAEGRATASSTGALTLGVSSVAEARANADAAGTLTLGVASVAESRVLASALSALALGVTSVAEARATAQAGATFVLGVYATAGIARVIRYIDAITTIRPRYYSIITIGLQYGSDITLQTAQRSDVTIATKQSSDITVIANESSDITTVSGEP